VVATSGNAISISNNVVRKRVGHPQNTPNSPNLNPKYLNNRFIVVAKILNMSSYRHILILITVLDRAT
jgi:hypothetical protein